jgi:chitinase
MKRLLRVILIISTGCAAGPGQTHWVSAYYAGWAQWNAAPVDIPQIDFSCATHWIFFTMVPAESGTFDGTASGMDTARLRQFAAAAHAAGRKAIIGTGGWGADYTGAVSNAAISINDLTGLMQTYDYDGIDIDWEPVPSGQYANFTSWVKDLKTAMQRVKSGAVLTAAAMGFDRALVNNQKYFDQINLMTYDMAGPYPGWVSWHNAPIYDGGNRFPSTGELLPSIDGSVNRYLNAGVPASKLGFGIAFYGYIWNGVTAPLQSNFGTIQNTVPYSQITKTYGGLPLQWDTGAQAAYYAAPHQFVSYDADTTIGVKAGYMKAKGLGGVILYEVAAGYRDDLPAGHKDRLLKKVKQAFIGGALLPSDSIPPRVTITTSWELPFLPAGGEWRLDGQFGRTKLLRSAVTIIGPDR